jgi:hypothetical protein
MVGRSKSSFARGRFRATVIWALVPLALWNGRPVSGCVCADGHFERNCPVLAARMRQTEGQRSERESYCGCAGCAAVGSDKKDSRSCHNETGCCERSSPSQRPDGTEVDSKNCCRPAVQSPLLPPLVTSIQLADDHHLPALLAASLESASSLGATHVRYRVDNDTGPPPRDLVVTLRRLVI